MLVNIVYTFIMLVNIVYMFIMLVNIVYFFFMHFYTSQYQILKERNTEYLEFLLMYASTLVPCKDMYKRMYNVHNNYN